MYLFSILFVIISSYLITRSLKSKDNFLYFLLIAFSQIVLSFEVLSIFSAISKNNFLICNAVFLVISVIFFYLRGKNKSNFQFSILNSQLFKALKRDKFLMFLAFCFVIFTICNIIRLVFLPISMLDAFSYYYPRCTTWLQQGNILHYITPDTRELIMPVNMDFLYMWQLMFTKNETAMGIFSFIGYFGLIYIVYNFLKELHFSIRSRLWTIFVFSSFALVMIEAINPCADLFAGTLILSSIYLFLKSVKYNDKMALFFSSLSYALAVGCKTTAIIAIPSVFLIFCSINYLYKKNIKQTILFCLLFILNFFIFSSYNYILNFIQYGNPVSDPSCFIINEFTGGLKGYISNVIKYFFAFFDMSGMPKYIDINDFINNMQNFVLELFNTNNEMGGAVGLFSTDFTFNNNMGITMTALGFMGLITFFPSIVYSVKRVIICFVCQNKNNSQFQSYSTHQLINSSTKKIMAVLALSVIFNIFLFSRVMVFTNSNMRYILTFMVIAFPCLVYSYPRRKHIFCKIFLCLIMFNYLIGTHISGPIRYVKDYIIAFKHIELGGYNEEKGIFDAFIKMEPRSIAIISTHPGQQIYFIEKLKLYGFYMDKILPENIEDYDLSKYDYIISDEIGITSTNILKYEERSQYPYRFVSRCDYVNKYMQPLREGETPAFSECYIPFEYLFDKGFIVDNDFKFNRYIILRKIRS